MPTLPNTLLLTGSLLLLTAPAFAGSITLNGFAEVNDDAATNVAYGPTAATAPPDAAVFDSAFAEDSTDDLPSSARAAGFGTTSGRFFVGAEGQFNYTAQSQSLFSDLYENTTGVDQNVIFDYHIYGGALSISCGPVGSCPIPGQSAWVELAIDIIGNTSGVRDGLTGLLAADFMATSFTRIDMAHSTTDVGNVSQTLTQTGFQLDTPDPDDGDGLFNDASSMAFLWDEFDGVLDFGTVASGDFAYIDYNARIKTWGYSGVEGGGATTPCDQGFDGEVSSVGTASDGTPDPCFRSNGAFGDPAGFSGGPPGPAGGTFAASPTVPVPAPPVLALVLIGLSILLLRRQRG